MIRAILSTSLLCLVCLEVECLNRKNLRIRNLLLQSSRRFTPRLPFRCTSQSRARKIKACKMKGRGVGRPSHQTCIVKLLVAFGLELLELRNAARHIRETAPKSKMKGNKTKKIERTQGRQRTLCRFPPAGRSWTCPEEWTACG